MKKVYVVNSCDAWKSYSSFRLFGIFTSRKHLNDALKKMLKCNDIEWSDPDCPDNHLNDLTVKELHDNLDYVSIEEITLNEIQ